MANEIQIVNINKELTTSVKDPVNFVNSLSLQQALDLLTIIKLWTETSKDDDSTNFMKALENKIYNSNVDNLITVLNGGFMYETKVIRGQETTKTIKRKITDYDLAVKFAQEHGYNVPMTERQIIEPKVDTVKLEQEQWFQENVNLFKKYVVETKTINSSNQVRTKEIKQGE